MVEDDRQRIDKWLWFARLAKTRTAAQKLAVSGRVRVNREKNEQASRLVRIGDVLTVTLDAGIRVLKIAAIAERRGPGAAARLLYEDLSAPPLAARNPATPAPIAREPGSGRPTKRDRRATERLRRNPEAGDDFSSGED
jgi:ribosome-associated heat shock protein Hsp15